MRALIVDDSRTIRMILRRTLGELGFQVEEAEDGKEALATLAKDADFDFVLIDWNMPNINGFELVQAIRADASLGEMRLLMVTTESEMSRVTEALGAGVNEYIMKPFTPEIVVEKLKLLGMLAT